MATLGNLLPSIENVFNVSTIQATSLEHGTEILFFSVFLRAILFISSEGELRVNPACGVSGEVKQHERMLRYCLGDNHKMCFFASRDMKFMLSMDAESGMLRTVQTPAVLSARSQTTCTIFEETAVPNRFNSVTTLMGCPGSVDARKIVFSGRRVRKTSCAGNIGPFSQTVSETVKHHQPYVQTRLNVYRTNALCGVNFVRGCESKVRESYPLHFSPCSASA